MKSEVQRSEVPRERVLSAGDGSVPPDGSERPREPETPRIQTTWLLRLRWGTFAAEIAMIVSAEGLLGLHLPIVPLILLAAVVPATNVALQWSNASRRYLNAHWLGSILAFDTLQLTAVLFLSGGTSNPFSVFYLVQITLAAVMLGSRWTWFVTVLSIGGYGALFALPPSATPTNHTIHSYAIHLQAMWVAFTLSATLTAYFVTRLTTRVADSQRELAAIREVAARHERLAAVTTLAAGAAHQLGTPLATVAVAAGELEHALRNMGGGATDALLDDVKLIRAEIKRSREILEGMASETGRSAGEMPTEFATAELAADIIAQLGTADQGRVRITDRGGGRLLFLPRHAVARAVLSLVRNAIDAAPPGDSVSLEFDVNGNVQISVRDRGPGIHADVLARAGEPFFTTKAPGRGLGLGLFLARSLADDLHGRLALQSSRDGTTALLMLPARIVYDESATV